MELLQTTLCYLEKDGAYLMLHRVKKKNDVNHDKWVGVGGKFEPGEDALACALREVREETGLTMHAPVYRGIVDFFCDPWPAERMHLYTCTDFSGVMTDCEAKFYAEGKNINRCVATMQPWEEPEEEDTPEEADETAE